MSGSSFNASTAGRWSPSGRAKSRPRSAPSVHRALRRVLRMRPGPGDESNPRLLQRRLRRRQAEERLVHPTGIGHRPVVLPGADDEAMAPVQRRCVQRIARRGGAKRGEVAGAATAKILLRHLRPGRRSRQHGAKRRGEERSKNHPVFSLRAFRCRIGMTLEAAGLQHLAHYAKNERMHHSFYCDRPGVRGERRRSNPLHPLFIRMAHGGRRGASPTCHGPQVGGKSRVEPLAANSPTRRTKGWRLHNPGLNNDRVTYALIIR